MNNSTNNEEKEENSTAKVDQSTTMIYPTEAAVIAESNQRAKEIERLEGHSENEEAYVIELSTEEVEQSIRGVGWDKKTEEYVRKCLKYSVAESLIDKTLKIRPLESEEITLQGVEEINFFIEIISSHNLSEECVQPSNEQEYTIELTEEELRESEKSVREQEIVAAIRWIVLTLRDGSCAEKPPLVKEIFDTNPAIPWKGPTYPIQSP